MERFAVVAVDRPVAGQFLRPSRFSRAYMFVVDSADRTHTSGMLSSHKLPKRATDISERASSSLHQPTRVRQFDMHGPISMQLPLMRARIAVHCDAPAFGTLME